MQCCSDLRQTTSSLHKHSGRLTTDQLCARERSARAGQLRKLRRTQALLSCETEHAHTPGSREHLQLRELLQSPASLQPPEWLLMENLRESVVYWYSI